MRNLHLEITERVIAQLKAGAAPWRKPWNVKAAEGGAAPFSAIPRNAVTGRAYSGINILLLWGKMDDGHFSDGRFLTFKQAKEAGGSVRKGEKGTEVIYVNFVEREDRRDPTKTARIPFLKSYYVFNVAQCDGLELGDAPIGAPIGVERDHAVDAFIGSTGARIQHGGARAFYTTAGDFIQMPPQASFHNSDGYYATLLHEIGHWTGASHRLDRQFGRKFGDKAYSAEELVAELASAFLCAEFAIDNSQQNAAYIANWIKFLSDHEKALVGAAAQASKAVEYLRGLAIADPLPIAA